MLLATYILLPISCIIVLLVSSVGRRNVVWSFVAGLAIYQFILLTVGLLLGHLQVFSSSLYGGVFTIIELSLIGGAVAGYLRNGALPLRYWWQSTTKIINTRRGLALGFLVMGIALLTGIQCIRDWVTGTEHIDGLQYHLPRVMFWMWNSGFEAWSSPVWQQLGLPIAADLILGNKLLMGLGWAGAAYANMWITIGAGLCVYIAARDFSFTHWQGSIATILFLSFPAVGLRMGHMNSDIVAAFPVMAGYALWRIGPTSRYGTLIFLLMSAIAISCKITVLPFVILLGLIGVWRQVKSIFSRNLFKALIVLLLILVLGIIIIWGSYSPVYEHFGSSLGGDFHLKGTVLSEENMEFIPIASQRVLFNIVQWAAEPLGYIPRVWRDWLMSNLGFEKLYPLLGAGTGPSWWPNGSPDTTRTGLIPFVMLPFLLIILPRKVAILSFILVVVCLVGIHAPLPVSPWRGRYTVVLLAGYSLLWVAPLKLTSGRWRWTLIFLVALNVTAAVSSAGLWSYRSLTNHWIKKTNSFGYFTSNERSELASELKGKPLLLISESGTLDALIPGPEMAFRYKYIVCPENDDWEQLLLQAHEQSNRILLIHLGYDKYYPGPRWAAKVVKPCPNYPVGDVRNALVSSGWHSCGKKVLYNGVMELWSGE